MSASKSTELANAVVTGVVIKKYYDGDMINDEELTIATKTLKSFVRLFNRLPDNFGLAQAELFRLSCTFERFESTRKKQ